MHMKQRNGWFVQLAILVLVVGWLGQFGAADEDQKYLVPFLTAGPSNQKRDLRSALTAGRLLGRTVVLTGIFKHGMDVGKKGHETQQKLLNPATTETVPCFEENAAGYLPMRTIANVESLSKEFDVILLEDLMKQGWDGRIDGLVFAEQYLEKHKGYMIRTLAYTNISVEEAKPVPMDWSLAKCNPDKLKQMTEGSKPYKYLGFVSLGLGNNTVPNLPYEEGVDVGTLTGCVRAVAEGNRALLPPEWIQQVADRYIEQHIGDQGFMCVQIRPYPDTCLRAWRDGDLEPGVPLNEPICKNTLVNFHDRVGPCTAKYAKKMGLENAKLFVMSHPAIRHQIFKRLAQVGLANISFMDPHLVEKIAGCIDHSATFLVLVEEAVCLRAKGFLGTHSSSVTQSLGFMRLGHNRKGNAYFEYMRDC